MSYHILSPIRIKRNQVPVYFKASRKDLIRARYLYKTRQLPTEGDNDSVIGLLHFFNKYDNDLLRYWLLEDHPCSDKWIHYFDVYDKWFSKFRNTDLTMIEIGVQNGGSLYTWKNYFGPKAHIIGIDITKKVRQFEDEQISIEIGDQSKVSFWQYIKEKYPKVDILLDDGGHTMVQQKTTFNCMFPHISEGGIYICEDCHTSCMQSHGESYGSPDTFIEFTKSLVDELNGFYDKDHPPTELSYTIGGLHFYDSMVVLEKKDRIIPPISFRIGEPTVNKFSNAIYDD